MDAAVGQITHHQQGRAAGAVMEIIKKIIIKCKKKICSTLVNMKNHQFHSSSFIFYRHVFCRSNMETVFCQLKQMLTILTGGTVHRPVFLYLYFNDFIWHWDFLSL